MPLPRSPKTLVISLALSLLVGASAAFAGWSKSGASEIRFSARGTGGFSFTGTTPDLEVQDDGKLLTLTVPLKNLTTGIALRDRHMKENYLEVDKHPTTSLVVAFETLKLPAGAGPLKGEAKGRYTLRAVTKEVPFTYEGTCDATGLCQVKGELKLNITDYGIKVPSYLGITVKPDVVVHATFAMKRD
jgi:polyisoprenoid-binding protein YceI